jgi:RimJ/RimL family protein N-acetyltransferase
MDIIKTKKFILRPYKIADAEEIAKLLNNWNVVKNLSSLPFPYKKKDAIDFIKKISAEMKKEKPEDFVMTIEIAGKPAGAIGIHHIEHRHKAELGYWLAEDFWGQGIMPKALVKFLEFVTKKFELRRIYARMYVKNKGSMRVAEKVGMKFEGIARKEALKDGKYIDCAIYAKTKN